MNKGLKAIFISVSLVSIYCGLLASPILARPNHKNKPHDRRNHNVNYDRNSDLLDARLNNIQRNQLISILRGDSRDSYLLNPSIRFEIHNQIHSLPPGIQKRLAKGKGLPPGIAKQVNLPYTINDNLNLSRDVNIVVAGGTAIVVDPLTKIVVDLLKDIF